MTIGNDGIITKAQSAVDIYKNAQEKEKIEIAKVEEDIDNYIDGNRNNKNGIKIYKIEGTIDTSKKILYPTGYTSDNLIPIQLLIRNENDTGWFTPDDNSYLETTTDGIGIKTSSYNGRKYIAYFELIN